MIKSHHANHSNEEGDYVTGKGETIERVDVPRYVSVQDFNDAAKLLPDFLFS